MTKIKLVLCDNNGADLRELCESADDYINQRGFYGETICFSQSEDVLNYSEKSDENSVTVYLLDVIMPEIDGIALGRKIRERDKNSVIIYISTSREYSLDAFSVRAFSYLIKPYSREKLFSELDECLNRVEVEPQKLSIKTTESTMLLSMSDIIAVEYLNHRLIFHTVNGEKIESAYRRQSFDIQAELILQTGVFLKISASYLVNLRNIQGIKGDEFVMCDGSQYKITRKYAAARQRYINNEVSND